MASTYSALKIQLMATGENSGTWGNVTNVNLGTALEEAIVGSADVTFSSGTVTLTLTDSNSSQTARNLRLNLTGTSGGAQNLIVPAIEKVYIVNNGCADAITVKNSTGTGIAVPAGKTMWVYNNGTNVVDAVTHLTSLTLGTPLANSQTTASSSNGASTIVARDSNGSFSANAGSFTTVTGAGSGLTAINASNISSGTIPNARTTASSVNSASTLVLRDANGDFNAGVIIATTMNATTFNGSGSGISALNTGASYQVGSFGVGTAASGTGGEIRATNNITAYYSSDAKFKENVRDIDNATAKVTAIGGKYFDWTDAYIAEHGGEDGYFIQKADFGVIAQDVQAVFPQAVRSRPDGSLAVDYEKLSALAFAAIAELVKRVEVLEGK
jgi:hypothetical protein